MTIIVTLWALLYLALAVVAYAISAPCYKSIVGLFLGDCRKVSGGVGLGIKNVLSALECKD